MDSYNSLYTERSHIMRVAEGTISAQANTKPEQLFSDLLDAHHQAQSELTRILGFINQAEAHQEQGNKKGVSGNL